ncbi:MULTISPECIES: mechanosensitive ion channel family protein [unclassified Coleofasciculus]|uniref:mechanosensitive ion channel family protein n=1 Tax=unclassified Coleofasciculus TaxID=2692782 RepID=UPI00187E8465|nr:MULTISPECIES: mechanosensitive ion channel family protein [unclassified Coleofasciculus]MBE9129205.1 mechanosensitive ion channel family protein [Coleofasciculus sp. LEGE 07081]MBE9149709.1 mechanosensitive ion channel family protein [Coleofasciculus sp. LEGE 07092]
MNILIIAAEVSLLIVLFALFHWSVGKLFKQLGKLPWLKGTYRSVKTLHRNIQAVLIFSCAVLCLAVVGANSWLLYQGENLPDYTVALTQRVPVIFWWTLALGIAKSISILILAGIVVRTFHHSLKVTCDRAKNFEQLTANDDSIEEFFDFLNVTLTNGTWFLSVIWCSQFLQLPKVVPQYLSILLKIYLIVAVGLLIFKATAAIIDSLDALSNKYSNSDNLLQFYDRLQHLIPFLKRCLEYAIYVCMATLIVQQVELIAELADYGPKIVKIIGIIFMSRVLGEVAHLVVEEVLLKNKNLTEVQRQRRLTLIPLVQSILRYTIYFSAGIAILDTLDIDPTPILAAAGIVGLAVGFGAQNLINDMVCGFFILFENYYLVGDYIKTGNAEGTVEAIELRTTRIRHPNGQQQILRNGDIKDIVNYSKQYIYAVVEVGVAYDSNLDRVYQVIEDVGKQLHAHHPDILEPTRADGLQNFGESELLIRTLTKVKPGNHLRIQRVLRKMIKEAFDTEGIEIPFARRVLIFKNAEGNVKDLR